MFNPFAFINNGLDNCMIPETKGRSLEEMFFFFLVVCSTHQRMTEISNAGAQAYLGRLNTIDDKDDEISTGKPGANSRVAWL
jgi:hypothetical protein